MQSQIDIEQVKRLATNARPRQLIPLWQRMIRAEIDADEASTRIMAREVLAIIEDSWANETTALFRAFST